MRLALVGTTVGVLVAGHTLAAQESTADPTADISAAEIVSHIDVLARDSMQGRIVPGSALDRTAQYVAEQFARLGLQPGGALVKPGDAHSERSWVQRYPLPGHTAGGFVFLKGSLSHDGKRVLLEAGDEVTSDINLVFGTDALPAREMAEINVSVFAPPPPTVLLAGPQTEASVAKVMARLQGADVLYVPRRDADSATEEAVIRTLYHANPGRGAIVIVGDSPAAFSARIRASSAQAPRMVDLYMIGASATPRGWAVYVREEAIAPFLQRFGGVDVPSVRASTTPLTQSLGAVSTVLNPGQELGDTARPPVVIGMIEGEDPKLKSQYVVFSAHLDPLGADAAEDNASGVAGLLALARIFRAPNVHLRRSIAFVATSGAATDFAGANFLSGWGSNTAVDYRAIVANITLDMIGRRAGDSIAVDGAGDLELAATPEWLLTAHPDLRLHLASGPLRYAPESDYFAFARHGVPSLYFHNGNHPSRPASTSHAATGPTAASAGDALTNIDAEQEARILRLAFYVGSGLANAEHRPRWTAEGRRRRLSTLGYE